MATGASDYTYPAEGSRDATGKLTPPPPYSNTADPWNTSGKPADPGVPYWQPQQPGYTGFPISNSGFHYTPVEGFNTNDDAMLIPEAVDGIAIVRERESFVKQIVLSCVVFCLCCWPLGLTAFILAMMAHSKSQYPDDFNQAESHRLGVRSYRTSLAGVVIGTILLVIFCILYFTTNLYH